MRSTYEFGKGFEVYPHAGSNGTFILYLCPQAINPFERCLHAASYEDIQDHFEEVHLNVALWRCSICTVSTQSFSTFADLNQHVSKKHRGPASRGNAILEAAATYVARARSSRILTMRPDGRIHVLDPGSVGPGVEYLAPRVQSESTSRHCDFPSVAEAARQSRESGLLLCKPWSGAPQSKLPPPPPSGCPQPQPQPWLTGTSTSHTGAGTSHVHMNWSHHHNHQPYGPGQSLGPPAPPPQYGQFDNRFVGPGQLLGPPAPQYGQFDTRTWFG